VIDPATNTQVLPSITVTGKDPGDLVAHPDAITVYAMVGSNLSVIDVLSNSEFVSLMAVGDQFNHLAISPDGSRLYLAYFTVGMGGTLTVKIKVYDTTDSKNPALITTISDPIFDGCSMPLGLGVSPAGNRLYTACRMSDTSLPDNFYMVDTSSNVPTLTATFGRDANITTINAISVKPDGSKVYLARHASGSTANSTVEVFDGSTGASLTSIALADTDNPKAGVFSPDGSLLYVADISNGVHVINTASDTVAATMPKVTSEGFDIGIMPDGSRVYTPLLTKIFVNDTATNTPITTITGDFTNVQNIVVTPGLPGPLGPDLIMTEVMPNAALIVPGGTLSVTDTVKNQGTVSTGGSFLIGYGLSLNTTYGDGDDIPITTTRSVGPVAFGATDTATTSLLIPASTPPGIYHVCANADSTGAVVESNETNNTLCSTATVASAVPDLIMTAVTPNASVVSSAGKLSVSDTVKNLGPVSSGSFKVGYKLSPSGSYDDPGAVASTTTRTVSSLGPSPATNTAPGTILTFPTTIPPGVYFLCAKADSAGVVTELDETNNTLCSASPVTVPAADLLMTAASTTTTVIAPSKTLSLSNTVKNQGGFPAGSFTVAFHLSTDNIYGGGDDVAFTTTRSVTSLAAGGTSAATTSLTIPAATPLGTYYVCVLADSANTVAESNETNNSLCTSTTIQVTRPDLIMTEVTPNAGTVNQGATLSVTNAVQNQGLLTTGVSFRVGFHLSTNTTYGDGDDIAITTTRSVTALAAGASSSVTTSLTIPATTLPGTYYVCAMADSLNGVVETDETNNTLCSSGTVSVPPADLIMSAASTTATTVAAGANFSLSNSVKNQGGSKSGAFVIAFHLSTDNNYGGGDDVVITQTRSITSLAIGATSTASTTLTVPSLTASGTYYVCAMADSNNTVAEGDETNNSRCTTTTINVP
jgi:subtilase family serine protease